MPQQCTRYSLSTAEHGGSCCPDKENGMRDVDGETAGCVRACAVPENLSKEPKQGKPRICPAGDLIS